MRKINGCVQFPFFLTLLTPKEKKAYKEFNTKELHGVKLGVKLASNGFYLTPRILSASNLCHYFDAFYIFDYYVFTGFLKISASNWRQINLKIDAV